jgi:hypothetical protein
MISQESNNFIILVPLKLQPLECMKQIAYFNNLKDIIKDLGLGVDVIKWKQLG